MNKFFTGLFFSLIFTLSFSVGQAQKLKENDAFPKNVKDVKITDLRTGKAISLANLIPKNSIVIVDFWAHWCTPCKEAMPAIDQLGAKYKAKGVKVIGINVDEKAEDGKKFEKEHPVSFPVYHDKGQKLVNAIGVSTMPTSLIVGKDGSIKMIHKGYRTGDISKYEEELMKHIK